MKNEITETINNIVTIAANLTREIGQNYKGKTYEAAEFAEIIARHIENIKLRENQNVE